MSKTVTETAAPISSTLTTSKTTFKEPSQKLSVSAASKDSQSDLFSETLSKSVIQTVTETATTKISSSTTIFSTNSFETENTEQFDTITSEREFGQFSLSTISPLPITLQSLPESQKLNDFSFSSVFETSTTTSLLASQNTEFLTKLSPLWLQEQFQISPNELITQERNRFLEFVKMTVLKAVDCGDFTCSLEYREEAVVQFLIFEN